VRGFYFAQVFFPPPVILKIYKRIQYHSAMEKI
jgi:hypothetical protein